MMRGSRPFWRTGSEFAISARLADGSSSNLDSRDRLFSRRWSAGAAVDTGSDTTEQPQETVTLLRSPQVSTIDVTQIGGVTIADNIPIIHGDLEECTFGGTGTSVRFGVRVRRKSDQQWVTSGYRTILYNQNNAIVSVISNRFEIENSLLAYEHRFELHNLTVAAPTIWRCYLDTTTIVEGILPVAEEHDAIQLYITSTSGTRTFNGGFLNLTAVRIPQSRITLNTWDFGALGSTPTITVPTGHANDQFGNITGINIQQSTSSRQQVRFVKGGTPLSAAGNYLSCPLAVIADTASSTATSISIGGDETVAQHRALYFHNMRSNAPAHIQQVTFDASPDSDTRRSWGMVLNGTQQIDAIQYGGITVTSNFTAGVLYSVVYRAKHDVSQVSLGTGSTNQVEILDPSPITYLTTTDIGTMTGALTNIQFGTSGGYVTAAQHTAAMARFNSTQRLSTTDVGLALVETVTTLQAIHAKLVGVGVKVGQKHRPAVHSMQARPEGGTGLRFNHGSNREIAAARYDRFRLNRTSGNFDNGKSVWVSKLRAVA